MSDYSDFFLNSASSVVQYELLQISHPHFTQTYYVVRNATQGLTVTLEDLSSQFFTYYPLKISPIENRADLDFGLNIDLGDLGEVLPTELDQVYNHDNFGTRPSVVYRTFRSDDLTSPLFGPIELGVESISFNREGCSFQAVAQLLNVNKTGETYSVDRYPMLRAFT